MNKTKILFVCMGNICRSPTAHAVMQHKIDELGLSDQYKVESAGTHGYHIGEKSDERSRALAREKGVDMEYVRSQKISINDYDYYDYILAMDRDNLELIEYYSPPNPKAEIALFLSFATQLEQTNRDEVPDPYYGGAQGFEDVFQLVEIGCDAIIQTLHQTSN